jgi:hypothetical protein
MRCQEPEHFLLSDELTPPYVPLWISSCASTTRIGCSHLRMSFCFFGLFLGPLQKRCE